MSEEKVWVLLNPAAGGGAAQEGWARQEPLVRETFPQVHLARTERAGDEGRIAQEACQARATLLIVAGGDGTLSAAADGLLRSGLDRGALPDLAMLPLGTGSDLDRSLTEGRETSARLARWSQRTPRPVDAGRITFLGKDPARARHWVNQSYIGFGAHVVARVNARSRPGGPSAYSRAVLPELLHYRPLQVHFGGDGAPAGPQGLANLIVANGRFSGGGMLTSPRSDLSDGSFDVQAMGPVSRWTLLRHLTKFREGRHLGLPGITTWKARSLEVRCDAGSTHDLVEADGDIVGRLPVRYDLLPQALSFRA